MKKTKLIRGLLTSVSSQRTQFKPYGYTLDFANQFVEPKIAVEIEIPADVVVDEQTGFMVMNLEGLKVILKATADAIDELDQDYKKEIQKKNQSW